MHRLNETSMLHYSLVEQALSTVADSLGITLPIQHERDLGKLLVQFESAVKQAISASEQCWQEAIEKFDKQVMGGFLKKARTEA